MVPANEKPEVNEELREKSRKETEIAVESIKLRVVEEEKNLAGLGGDAAKAKGREIEDVKDILKEMEDRVRCPISFPDCLNPSYHVLTQYLQLKELHAPAVTMQPQTGSSNDAMSGILAQVLGESNAESKARIEEATKNANDLSGLVKKKKAKPAAAVSNGATTGAGASSTNGKRKLEEEPADGGEGKRAKTEEMLDVIDRG
jgi:HAT1-interacting factor 1